MNICKKGGKGNEGNLSAVIKNVQVVRGLRKGKDQGRVVQGNIVADQSNKS